MDQRIVFAESVFVRAVRPVFGAVRAGFAVLGRWRERAHQRRALARFDDRLLRDIGVTRAEAHREINKPFWR
ncbi:MAG: DUF1127 domain-containing protein [Geminicoccales bacterium]